jgi:hypothetical protein
MVPRKQAGHMTCTRPQAERQNLLAMRASSTHDPDRVCRPGSDLLRRRQFETTVLLAQWFATPRRRAKTDEICSLLNIIWEPFPLAGIHLLSSTSLDDREWVRSSAAGARVTDSIGG